MVLNPYARPFSLEESIAERCLFLTFSNGFPLSEEQIVFFFDSMFPFQVVDVELERPMAGKPSLFGRVMFTQTCIPKIVLDYNERVSYNVFGRPLICRRFISRSRRIAARNGFIGAQW